MFIYLYYMSSTGTKTIAIFIIALLIGVGVGYGIGPMIGGTQTATSTGPQPLTGTITIGSLLPLTGDLGSYGENSRSAIELAENDFNAYLATMGQTWTLDIQIEDTATDPVKALEKLQELNAKGIGIIVGPQTSGETRNIKGYADSNNMLLISQSSTAPELAIAGDNVFRFVTDDTRQGPAIARALVNDGVTRIVPVHRGDAWGDGLVKTTVESFENLGGTADEGIRYNPETKEFSADTSILADKVQAHVDDVGKGKTAVLYIGFAEAVQFIQASSAHSILSEVNWYGSDGSAQLAELSSDPIAAEFAETTNFLNPIFAASKTSKNKHVVDSVSSQLGRTPDTYAVSAYDIVWVVGLSILDSGSTDVSTIKVAIPEVVNNYFGALGWIRLNAAGDLATADYELWQVIDGEWVQVGIYASSTDSIVKS